MFAKALLLMLLPITSFAAVNSSSNFDIKKLKAGDVLVGETTKTYGEDTGTQCEVRILAADDKNITLQATLLGSTYAPTATHRTFDLAGIRYQWKSPLSKDGYPSQVGECHDQTMVTLQRESFGSRVDLNYQAFSWCEHSFGEQIYLACAGLQKK